MCSPQRRLDDPNAALRVSARPFVTRGAALSLLFGSCFLLVRQQVASGSLGGWHAACLASTKRKSVARDDVSSPPIFARVNKAGTPVAGLLYRRRVDDYLPVQQYVAERRERVWSGLSRVGYLHPVLIFTPVLRCCYWATVTLVKRAPLYLSLITFVAFVYCIWRSSVPAPKK